MYWWGQLGPRAKSHDQHANNWLLKFISRSKDAWGKWAIWIVSHEQNLQFCIFSSCFGRFKWACKIAASLCVRSESARYRYRTNSEKGVKASPVPSGHRYHVASAAQWNRKKHCWKGTKEPAALTIQSGTCHLIYLTKCPGPYSSFLRCQRDLNKPQSTK